MNDPRQQSQFLDIVDRDEAERRFRSAFDPRPLECESVPISEGAGRILAEDVSATIDVPGFDRSNVDGFAVSAEDIYGAAEDQPIRLRLHADTVACGGPPPPVLLRGWAVGVATGAVIPRGADAVVMVEQTDLDGDSVIIRRAVVPGENVSFAGSDIACGETVLRAGDLLGPRESAALSAIGVTAVPVVRRPRIAVVSTGDEIAEPGQPLRIGQVYDSNAAYLTDRIRELGGEPVRFGIVRDEHDALRRVLESAVACDAVILSGGTSKGAGDVTYRVVRELGPPGIVVHGVALKPGKPLCLAVVERDGRRIPIAVLPGFPTSAMFTFHEFVAPMIATMAGRSRQRPSEILARTAFRINSERGRTEYFLVRLIPSPNAADPPTAYPMGKGSGSVTAFARADGFIAIDRNRESIDADTLTTVRLIGDRVRPADLTIVGSHCLGVDRIVNQLAERGIHAQVVTVGSTGGVESARRSECDIAGIHLLDPTTGEYNRAFVPPGSSLVTGYRRTQGIVFRAGDPTMNGRTAEEATARILSDGLRMVNRNRGSGTRILIDRLLGSARPDGYRYEVKSHSAVAVAVVQERADWGITILPAARSAGLGFIPLCDEHYDFLIPDVRRDRFAVQAFLEEMRSERTRHELRQIGFIVGDGPSSP